MHTDQLFFGSVFVYIYNRARINLLDSGNGLQKLLLAASRYSGYPENLSGVHVKADILDFSDALDISNIYVFDNKSLLRINRFGPLNIKSYRVTNHHIGHLLRIGGCRFKFSDISALAQDHHPVRYCHDFVKFVGNNDYRLAVFFHVAHNFKKTFALLRRQNRRRFIKYENIRSAENHFDYLDGLLFGNRHVIDFLVRIYDKSVLVAYLLYSGFDKCRVKFAAHVLRFPRWRNLTASTKYYVLPRGKYINQFEMLMHHSDSKPVSICRG